MIQKDTAPIALLELLAVETFVNNVLITLQYGDTALLVFSFSSSAITRVWRQLVGVLADVQERENSHLSMPDILVHLDLKY
jgi:hypothetical protein